MNVVLDDLSGGELLDHAELLVATQHRCEVEILRVAVQHAYLHDRDSLDPAETGRPGRERARRIGGAGTPEVAEFAASELGARLGMSTVSAGLLMADGLDLRHRLPRLWRGVEAGEVRVYLARLVARRTRDLTAEQAAYVDERVGPYADGRLTWTRFQSLVEGVVAAADPEATAAAERQAAEQQLARPMSRPVPVTTTTGCGGSTSGRRTRRSRSSTPHCSGSPTSWPTSATPTAVDSGGSRPCSSWLAPTSRPS